MVQIQREGIQAVADFADFEKQELQQLADNLRKPGGRIPDPNPNAAPGATIQMPAFTYGAKSQKSLTVACNGKVIQRTIGPDGKVTRTFDNNPFLNSIIQEIQIEDAGHPS